MEVVNEWRLAVGLGARTTGTGGWGGDGVGGGLIGVWCVVVWWECMCGVYWFMW